MTVPLKELPVGIPTFSEIITQNYLYVDKTMQINQIIQKGKYYFLSRPRRFGKSLLLSTLAAYFKGQRELFKDCWLGRDGNVDWKEYPVIHIDFSKFETADRATLFAGVHLQLVRIARHYNVILLASDCLDNILSDLIEQLAALNPANKVVILIDEYDKPILDNLDRPEVIDDLRRMLQGFYGAIKGSDAQLRFVFVAGITRFSGMSLFSGFNNLRDLSMQPSTATLLGYTQKELELYFAPYIQQLAVTSGKSTTAILDELRTWYNGYCFYPDLPTVYNPFSILNYFTEGVLANYWVKSGTPKFLITMLKKYAYADKKPKVLVGEYRASGSTLDSFDPQEVPLEALLFQAGYITIKDLDKNTGLYYLTYPNREVAEAMATYIMSVYAHISQATTGLLHNDFFYALQDHDLPKFIQTLQVLVDSIPYNLHMRHEHYYHSILHAALMMLKSTVQSEIMVSGGRIDMVLETSTRVYVTEVKFDKKPQVALDQIHENRYYAKYLGQSKPITLLGIAFNYDKETMQHVLVEWVVEEMAQHA